MKLRFLIPPLVFIVLVAVLGVGLTRDPREVPSPLIDKPAPAFAAPRLDEPAKRFEAADMRGQVWLLNVWASWCVACREEHAVLLALGDSGRVPLYGLDYKDTRTAGLNWLADSGDPYIATAVDPEGRIGMNYGVYGVPETYVIDRDGIIRYKQIGPLTPEVVQHKILPLVEELSR